VPSFDAHTHIPIKLLLLPLLLIHHCLISAFSLCHAEATQKSICPNFCAPQNERKKLRKSTQKDFSSFNNIFMEQRKENEVWFKDEGLVRQMES